MPFNIIHSSTMAPKDYKSTTFEVADQSDPGPYPMPPNLLQEGGPFSSNPNGDHHILVVDADTCMLYETYQVDQTTNPLKGYAGAIFDTSAYPNRPVEWTSADAAGLAIFPLLVRYDEVKSGAIHHAMRFTFNHTYNGYVYPATHKAGLSGMDLPPMVLLIRLKKTADVSTLGPQALIVAKALMTYGMFAADNGGSGFFQGEVNANWNNDDLGTLKKYHLNDFEVVVPAHPK